MTRILKYSFFGLGIFLCHLPIFALQLKIDSLKKVLQTVKEDTVKVKVLNDLSKHFFNKDSYDTSLFYSNSAKILAEKLIYKKGIAASLDNIARAYDYQGNASEALTYYFKALKINEELKDKINISANLGSIGVVYNFNGNYPKALEYDFKALKIAEELGDKNGMAINLSNIGNVYRNLGDYSKALNFYFRTLKTDEELENKSGIASDFHNIGMIYKKQGDYTKALEFYFKAFEINKELGKKRQIARTLGNIGNVFTEQGEYSKALEYFLNALKIDEELGNKAGMSAKLGNIGNLYIKKKDYKNAESYLEKASALSSEIKALDLIQEHQQSFSEVYSLMGNDKKAFAHYKKFIEARDSIYNEENTKKSIRTEMNFEFDKKEALAKVEQEKERVIAEEKNRKQRTIIWSTAGSLILVVLFTGFIFHSLKVTRKQKQIIETKSKETEQQKLIIEEKNKGITDSITYAKRIQHAKLPKKEEIISSLPQSFVLFKPKDIVSGDFYFFHKNHQSVFIAAADCTGHGVPGAFMSMIGSEKLNDAVSQSADTSEILKRVNKGIKTSLRQSDSDESTRDGMDIALCSLDMGKSILKFAGANRPLWIIRNGKKELEEIKATKKAIGGFTDDNQHFDSHEIKLQKGDTFYIFSDGYADTFNGQDGKKLKTKKFKEILIDIQHKNMYEQEEYLNDFVENWKAGTEQVDDILIIGVRL